MIHYLHALHFLPKNLFWKLLASTFFILPGFYDREKTFHSHSKSPLSLEISPRNPNNSLLFLVCCDYCQVYCFSTHSVQAPRHHRGRPRLVFGTSRPPHSLPSMESAPSVPSAVFGGVARVLVHGCRSTTAADTTVAIIEFGLEHGAEGESWRLERG